MELSNRLQAVADLLDYHEAIADIGCDHGFVSIYLIESKKASKVLAMDVNKGPLERAREHVSEKRLSTYIETRLSDGAKAINYIKDEQRWQNKKRKCYFRKSGWHGLYYHDSSKYAFKC